VLGVLPPRTEAFQWHRYTFGIPDGGTELARSDVCTQAFRLDGHAWGIQFHAEVTEPMLTAWAAEDTGDLPGPLDSFLAETADKIGDWNELGRRLCAAFLDAASSR
jgi:GMP synthase-like glutamine amidotransferase